jgi:signal transduction histidine kinase
LVVALGAAGVAAFVLVNDLPDGLAQDLAFIAAHGDRLARELGNEHPIVVAARRALHASRGAIVDLSAADAPTPAAALRAVAGEISIRSGVNVTVHADSTELTSHEREELVRIAREAMSNAAQHGHAREILVSLQARREKLVLRVDDDGCGIGVSAIPQRGLGLGWMRGRPRPSAASVMCARGPAEARNWRWWSSERG